LHALQAGSLTIVGIATAAPAQPWSVPMRAASMNAALVVAALLRAAQRAIRRSASVTRPAHEQAPARVTDGTFNERPAQDTASTGSAGEPARATVVARANRMAAIFTYFS